MTSKLEKRFYHEQNCKKGGRKLNETSIFEVKKSQITFLCVEKNVRVYFNKSYIDKIYFKQIVRSF